MFCLDVVYVTVSVIVVDVAREPLVPVIVMV